MRSSKSLRVGVDPAEAVGGPLLPLRDVVVHRQSLSWSLLRAGRPSSAASRALVITWSMKPYSFACWAVNHRSRSASRSTCSSGWPVCWAISSKQHLLDVQRLLGLDLDVGGRATHAAGRLVHHDPRVRQGVALALRAGAEQELTHRRRQAHADGRDVVGDVVHGVVDRHAGVDRTPGAVDVQEDVRLGILGGQQQQLGADRVGVLVAHLGPEEDDPLAEQPLVDVVVEAVGGGPAVHLRGAHPRLGRLGLRRLLDLVHAPTLDVGRVNSTAEGGLFAHSGFASRVSRRRGRWLRRGATTAARRGRRRG